MERNVDSGNKSSLQRCEHEPATAHGAHVPRKTHVRWSLMLGYASMQYARSLENSGQPVFLPGSKSWILERPIMGFEPEYDAMGCYPMFCCGNFSMLEADIAALPKEVVSLALVMDPFAPISRAELARVFDATCYPFKTHFVVDLVPGTLDRVASNHARNARKALNTLEIRRIEDPMMYLSRWNELYRVLISRHAVSGIAMFSDQSFRHQFMVPGLIAYGAFLGDRLIGMVLFYQMQDVIYYHLAAYDEDGYAGRASFGIFWKAIGDFIEKGCRWLNLGGGAGICEREDDGLTRFKRGWASASRSAFFCGKILNREKYDLLVGKSRVRNGDYFPLYRS